MGIEDARRVDVPARDGAIIGGADAVRREETEPRHPLGKDALSREQALAMRGSGWQAGKARRG